jgi:hypothetical protein
VFQDGELVANKQTRNGRKTFGREETKMNCLGCSFSQHYFQGRVTFLSFYDYAVSDSELEQLHVKLDQISQESNSGGATSGTVTPVTVTPVTVSPVTVTAAVTVAHVAPVPAPDSLQSRGTSPPSPDAPAHSSSSAAYQPARSSIPLLIREVNGSIIISTHQIENMLHQVNGSYVISSDNVQAAFKGNLLMT